MFYVSHKEDLVETNLQCVFAVAFEAFLNGVALHSDFFLALNRLRALISPNAKRVSLFYIIL